MKVVAPAVRVSYIKPFHHAESKEDLFACVIGGIYVEWLPRCAPELNDNELTWRDLKRHHLARRTIQNSANLDIAIHKAVHNLDAEHQKDHSSNKLRIAA